MQNKFSAFVNLENELKNDSSKNEQEKEGVLSYFYEHAERFKSDLSILRDFKSEEVLEIGSAPFHFTYLLKKLDYKVTGIDLDPTRFKTFIKKHNLNIVKCDIEKENLPLGDDKFKLIIFNETFEHLRIDPIHSLREINRVMSSKGILILTTPNLYSLKNIFSFLLGRGINNPLVEFQKLKDLGHMGHIREYSNREMKNFLTYTGFKIVKTNWKMYAKKTTNPVKLVAQIFYYALPLFRPYQVIICTKNSISSD